MEKTGCEIVRGAPPTLAVKGFVCFLLLQHVFQSGFNLLSVIYGDRGEGCVVTASGLSGIVYIQDNLCTIGNEAVVNFLFVSVSRLMTLQSWSRFWHWPCD